MSLGAETVASERRSEEKRNFNDPETSPAGFRGVECHRYLPRPPLLNLVLQTGEKKDPLPPR